MNCKKCGALVDKEAKFCPYCGENLKIENKESTYQDPFEKLRNDTSHQQQYQYQQAYSNNLNKIQYKDDLKKVDENIQKDNKSFIGLILAILAVPLTFIHIGLGLISTVIALILVIIGFKHTTKGIRVSSLIISIISFVIVLITSIFIGVSSIVITLDNGERVSIGDYFKSAFFNGYNSDEIENYWISEDNELFILDGSNYYLYMDASDLEKNSYSGNYYIDYGYDVGEDTIFEDENYFYYTLTIYGVNTDVSGAYGSYISNLLKGEVIVKLDKDDFKSICLIFVEEKQEVTLSKYNDVVNLG